MMSTRDEVMAALTRRVEFEREALLHLDALLSFAEVSSDFHYTRPALSAQGGLTRLVQARHPLLERVLSEGFVPNDVTVQAGRVLVLTGPNYSGKSCILKTVALISVIE